MVLKSKLETKSTKNRHDGVPEGILVEKSASLGCICKGSCFRLFFEGPKVQKLMIFGGSNL